MAFDRGIAFAIYALSHLPDDAVRREAAMTDAVATLSLLGMVVGE